MPQWAFLCCSLCHLSTIVSLPRILHPLDKIHFSILCSISGDWFVLSHTELEEQKKTKSFSLYRKQINVSSLFKSFLHLSPVLWSRALRCWSWTVTWRTTDTWWCHMMRICWGRPAMMSPCPRSSFRWERPKSQGHAENSSSDLSVKMLVYRLVNKLNWTREHFAGLCLRTSA